MTSIEYTRRLLIISGSQQWCNAQLLPIVERYRQSSIFLHTQEKNHCLINYTQADISISKRYFSILGHEFPLVIYDASLGLNPNAFCALSGSVVFGGLLVVILPEFSTWPNERDYDFERILPKSYLSNSPKLKRPFIEFIKSKLLSQASADVFIHDEPRSANKDLENWLMNGRLIDWEVPKSAIDYQERLIAELSRLFIEPESEKLTVFLQGQRGRGKTTTATNLVRRLIMSSPELNVYITAGSKFAAVKYGSLIEDNSQVRFYAPDSAELSSVTTGLLLIEEAATLSMLVIEKLLKQFSQVILISTTDGYEGSAQGLSMHLASIEKRLKIKRYHAVLKEPLRFSDNDFLEEFINDAFLLENKFNTSVTKSLNHAKHLQYDYSTDKDFEIISQIYRLLKQAHYKTTPDDLRFMLDSPQVKVFYTILEDVVISAIMFVIEGGDQGCSLEVFEGKRRPKGHLTPNILSQYNGFYNAFNYSYARVVRIATNKNYRRKGLATDLLDFSKTKLDTDFISSSFSASDSNVLFWKSQGFNVVRLGLKKETSSASYSVLCIAPLNNIPEGDLIIQGLSFDFFNNFLHLVYDHWRDLHHLTLVKVLSGLSLNSDIIGINELAQVRAVAYGYKSHLSISYILKKWIVMTMVNKCRDREYEINFEEMNVLIEVILKNKDLADAFPNLGEKLAANKFRQLLKTYID